MTTLQSFCDSCQTQSGITIAVTIEQDEKISGWFCLDCLKQYAVREIYIKRQHDRLFVGEGAYGRISHGKLYADYRLRFGTEYRRQSQEIMRLGHPCECCLWLETPNLDCPSCRGTGMIPMCTCTDDKGYRFLVKKWDMDSVRALLDAFLGKHISFKELKVARQII